MAAILKRCSFAIAFFATITSASLALAQSKSNKTDIGVPQSCLEAFENSMKWIACASEADPGSEASMLAYSNLGSQAYYNGDFQSAARFFDLSTPADGGAKQLDAFAHALRASTYWRIGADTKAKNHAKFSYDWVKSGKLGGVTQIELDNELLEPLLEVLVPVTAYLNTPEANDVLKRYQSIPLSSLMDAARRAGVLANIEEFDAALIYSAKVVAAQPDNPLFLSSHCLLLSRMGRAEKGLPFCKSALEKDANNPNFQFNTALVSATLGKCEDSLKSQTKAQQLAPRNPLYNEVIECNADAKTKK
ncbi:hypothetical protein [Hirschia maritima]|uniref:hypothetical protein n=1 Tax=Hirschia maritima TaxID=1121961 RepID=UPI000368555B|nr:hypothetical protein [Hirschia maritima]